MAPVIRWHRTDCFEREKEWEMTWVDLESGVNPNTKSSPTPHMQYLERGAESELYRVVIAGDDCPRSRAHAHTNTHVAILPSNVLNMIWKWMPNYIQYKSIWTIGRGDLGILVLFSFLIGMLITQVCSIHEKFIKLYTYDLCSFLYVYYTSMKSFK